MPAPPNYNYGTNAMNPIVAAAIPGALSALNGFLSGNRQEEMTEAQLAAEKERWANELRQRQAEQALQASQMDPLVQQRSRQLNALMSSLMMNSSKPTMDNPGSGINYNPAEFASFFTPGARENAERQFTSNASAATNGQYQGPTGVGYPGATAPVPTTPMTTTPVPGRAIPRIGIGRPGTEGGATDGRKRQRTIRELITQGAQV